MEEFFKYFSPRFIDISTYVHPLLRSWVTVRSPKRIIPEQLYNNSYIRTLIRN